MKVKDLVARLQQFNQELEIDFTDNETGRELEFMGLYAIFDNGEMEEFENCVDPEQADHLNLFLNWRD